MDYIKRSLKIVNKELETQAVIPNGGLLSSGGDKIKTDF